MSFNWWYGHPRSCIDVQGATLAFLDKEKEDYMKKMMKSNPADSSYRQVMCEYKLGKIYGLQMITVDSIVEVEMNRDDNKGKYFLLRAMSQ